ncbi:hypothetical protein NC652_006938 [Populus alba x Populus x berolinensis]|nr:hypothetical protein NC652_006938 [Populus alba x Populus x berolinensis]
MFSAVAMAFFLYSLAGLRKIRSKEGARREGFLFSSFFKQKKQKLKEGEEEEEEEGTEDKRKGS